MKFTITMKDPDYSGNEMSHNNSPMAKMLDKYLEYNEYVTIEFDTDKGTARVVPVEEGQ